VFGGTPVPDNETPFKPLEWQKSTALMAYLIDNLFSDTDPKCLWGTTARLFVYKGKAPNKDSLKSAVSKCKQDFRNKPKGYEILDDVLRSL
jgi:hypothetical protein